MYANANNLNRMARLGVGGLGGLGSDLRSAVISALFGAGEQGILIDPSDTSTLWKDTAGTDPVTADGDLVARIDDLSGNGNHLTQADAAARPKYRTDGTLHWLEGDAVDDYMDLPESTFGLFRNVEHGVVASAGRSQNLSAESFQAIIHFSTGNSSTGSRLADRYQHSDLDSMGAGARQTDGEGITTALVAADTNRHTIISHARWIEGGLDAYVDGSLAATSSFPASSNTSNTDSRAAFLLTFSSASPGPVEACAALARAGSMTTSQIDILNQWLNAKAGL